MALQGRRSPDMHKTSRRIRLAKRGLGPRWCRDRRLLDSRLTVDWTRWRLGFDSLASFECSARCSTSPSAAGKRPQRNSFALATNRSLTPNSPYAKTILLSQLCTVDAVVTGNISCSIYRRSFAVNAGAEPSEDKHCSSVPSWRPQPRAFSSIRNPWMAASTACDAQETAPCADIVSIPGPIQYIKSVDASEEAAATSAYSR